MLYIGLCILLFATAMPVQAADAKDWSTTPMEELIQYQPLVDNCYDFTVTNGWNVTISNLQATDSHVVYMEYEVGTVSQDKTYVTSLFASGSPNVIGDEGVGKCYSRYVAHQNSGSPLLVSGAKYYICFVDREDKVEFFVQRTLNGKSEQIKFPVEHKTDRFDYKYFTISFGEYLQNKITCEFKNFKCYDEQGRDLGVQFNKHNSQTEIRRKGLQSDTTVFKAAYYCDEKPELGMIVLGENGKGYRDLQGKKEEFNYAVYGQGEEPASLHLGFKSGKEIFDYQYVIMTDSEGNKFNRINDVKVTFDNDGVTEVHTLSHKTGYRITEPEAPTKKGTKFTGWYLGNGEKFDFNSLVTESITLYASWEDGPEFEELEDAIISTGANTQAKKLSSTAKVMIASVSAITIVGCAICGILILRKKNYANK